MIWKPTFFALLSTCLLVSLAAAARPNIVLIVSDDMGYSDLGCYGGEIETPNLDGLAETGLRFTNYYVNNMCWPTRASLMTGLYPKTALPKNGSAAGGLHPDAKTLPQALRQSGYATIMSGKWHLSDPSKPDGPNSPHRRGFDRFYGTIFGASDFFAPVDLQLNGKSMTHQWKDNPDYYYTDAITDQALGFLKQHQTQSAQKPFFLYVTYTAAHWPLHAKPDDIAHYHGRYAMGWDQLRRQRYARMKKLGIVKANRRLSPRNEKVPAWEKADHKPWQQRRMEVYAAQVTCMDRNIGRIISQLKNVGSFDNTLMLFHHDNGGCHVEYTTDRTGSWTREMTTDGKQQPVKPGNVPGLMPGPQSTFQSYGYGWANASNTPFRLFKQFDHEGGTRSPLIVSWPDQIKPDIVGELADQVCHAIDIMPTLLDVAAADVQQKPMPIEGQSLLPLIVGDKGTWKPHDAIYWAHSRGKAIRVGDWKLTSANKGDWELYNLAEDATECSDLADKLPGKVAELAKRHADWAERTDLAKNKTKN